MKFEVSATGHERGCDRVSNPVRPIVTTFGILALTKISNLSPPPTPWQIPIVYVMGPYSNPSFCACRLEPHRPLRSSDPNHHVANVRGFELHQRPHSTVGGRGIKEDNRNAPGPPRRTITLSEPPSLYQQPRKGPRHEEGTHRNMTAPQLPSASAPSIPKTQPHRHSALNQQSVQSRRTNSQPNDGGTKERNGQLIGGPKTKRELKEGTERGARLESQAGKSSTVQSGESKKPDKKKRGKKRTMSGTNTSRDPHR